MKSEQLVPNSLAAAMAVCDAAFAALWPVLKRRDADETRGFTDFVQWRANFVFRRYRARYMDRMLIENCREALKYEDLRDDERSNLVRAIDLVDSLQK